MADQIFKTQHCLLSLLLPEIDLEIQLSRWSKLSEQVKVDILPCTSLPESLQIIVQTIRICRYHPLQAFLGRIWITNTLT